MQQYMLSVYMVEGIEDPAPDVMQQMYMDVDKFNNEIKASGNLVFAGGLHPADRSTTLRPKGGEVLVTDGPFAESKEHVGGFWIIKANDLDEAIAIGKRGALACQGEVEVRPFQEEPEA